MAARFFVGGSGNWSDTAHWSTTSGGGGGAAVPTSADDVTIDANSGTTPTVTVDVAANANTVTLNKSDATLLCNAGMTVAGQLTLTLGTLNTNGQAMSCALLSSLLAYAERTFTFGASTITLTGPGAALQVDATNATVTVNTALMQSSVASTNFTLSGNWNGLSISHTGGGSTPLSGLSLINCGATGVTLKNVTWTGGGGFGLTGNVTITGTLTIAGTTTQGNGRMWAGSNARGTQRTLAMSGGAIVISGDVDFMDFDVTGSPSWTNSGNAFIGDCLGNGTFISSRRTTPATQTFVGGAANWSDATKWTSRVPLPQDDVVIATGAGTLTGDRDRLGRNVDFTGFTGTYANSNNSAEVYGNLTFSNDGNYANSNFTLAGRGAQTLSAAGAGTGNTPNGWRIDAAGGTYTLASNLRNVAATAGVDLRRGGFDAAGYNIDATSVTTANGGSNVRTLTCGSGTWTLNGTGTVWNIASTTNLTVNAASATLLITDTSGTAKTFVGAGLSYGTLRHTATGAAGLTITGNNSFLDLDLECTTARTITLPANGVQRVGGQLTLQGAASQLLSVVSSSPGTQTTIKAIYTKVTQSNTSLSADVLLLFSSFVYSGHKLVRNALLRR